MVFGIALLVASFAGCGYTQKAKLPNNIKTLAVPTFLNEIPARKIYTYEPGLETKITNAVRDRIIFDGNARLVNEDEADALIVGKLIRFDQEPLGFDNLERVDRFRLIVTTDLKLIDRRTQEVLIHEPNFTGDFIYQVAGRGAVSEQDASQQAITKLARDIVDRIVENW